MANGKSTPPDSYLLEVSDRSFGFFIYFYDEKRGHVLLFAHPTKLKDNESEKQILQIHPAWWHQEQFLKSDKFSTIDLELSEVVYSATLFVSKTQRVKQRPGMDAAKWQQERFILIVKAPSEISFIAQEILQEFHNQINDHFADKLCVLVEHNLSRLINPEISNEARAIEKQLMEVCDSLIPKLPISRLKPLLESSQKEQTLTKHKLSKKKLRFAIPTSKDSKHITKNNTKDKQKKSVKILPIERVDNVVKLTIKNISGFPLTNVKVRIYESQGFFGEDKKVKKIPVWDPEKIVDIEFISKNEGGILYLLKIEDESETIRIKRI
ncbi:MAG: hypothetical protein KAT16_02650 [Candidatus Heimdallarchaeota archaeon]|nr:hypothetical protein [Candidatus Heimdallarchaeota archaeon]